MTLRPSVEICSSDGVHLYRLHREAAAKLLGAGSARRANKGRLVLCDLPGTPRRAKPAGLAQYIGTRYTYRERLADHTVTSLRHIDSRDAPLFRLSVTDCLVCR